MSIGKNPVYVKYFPKPRRDLSAIAFISHFEHFYSKKIHNFILIYKKL